MHGAACGAPFPARAIAMRMQAHRLASLAVGLCRFRTAPQDLPFSPRLLVALVVAAVALDTFVGARFDDSGDAFARAALGAAVVLGLSWTALAIRRLPQRYVQTASALLLCGLAVSLVQLPLALLLEPLPADASAPASPFQMLLRWTLLATLVWQVVAFAHIMRHAIEARLGLALVLVTSWMVAAFALDSLLFGAAA